MVNVTAVLPRRSRPGDRAPHPWRRPRGAALPSTPAGPCYARPTRHAAFVLGYAVAGRGSHRGRRAPARPRGFRTWTKIWRRLYSARHARNHRTSCPARAPSSSRFASSPWSPSGSCPPPSAAASWRRPGYNLFKVRAQDVTFDLLTDSGTSAMSARQWAGIMVGDESYAGSPSFQRFEKSGAGSDRHGKRRPDAPGKVGGVPPDAGARLAKGDIVVGNTHFDTTRANIEHSGARGAGPALPGDRGHPVRGALQGQHRPARPSPGCLEKDAARVRLVIITVTNNSVGGQPVSMENIRGARRILAAARDPALPRRRPVRGERILHQEAREGVTRTATCAKSPARCSPSATAR